MTEQERDYLRPYLVVMDLDRKAFEKHKAEAWKAVIAAESKPRKSGLRKWFEACVEASIKYRKRPARVEFKDDLWARST